MAVIPFISRQTGRLLGGVQRARPTLFLSAPKNKRLLAYQIKKAAVNPANEKPSRFPAVKATNPTNLPQAKSKDRSNEK